MKNHLQSLCPDPIGDWSGIESIIKKRQVSKHDYFFKYSDRSNEVAIVESGLFRIYLTNAIGEEKTYSFIPENSFILDFFLSWQDNSHVKISVQALEDSDIYVLEYTDFLNLMRETPVWNNIYREVLLKNYIFKTKREIEFVQFNAKQRLNKFIASQRIDIRRIPKLHLASYLGIQPPSLSRLLKELKSEC